jgi:chromosome segregation protein
MKVKALEISGFKTFVDRVQLSFKPGITALVGPNGCGKSNIIDAFRWIMGEQNARNLRGKFMEDLIFNGSESRKPLGMAEVSLVMSNENGHSTNDHIQEIMVTRRLYRSGESEYFINKIPCRLKDIVELFLDAGVGLKSYSIMEQGRVDHILSLKPPERRVLIEEVAGIAKYRARKKEAASKMESTKQNLLRIRDILNEIQTQLAILEKQVKRLHRYRKIKDEIKRIDLLLAARKLQAFTEAEQLKQSELSGLRDEEIRIAAQKEASAAALEEKRLLLLESSRRISELQNDLYQIKNTINGEERKLEYNKKELVNTVELTDKNGARLNEFYAERATLDTDIAARSSEVADFEAEIQRLQQDYSQSTLSVSQLQKTLSELRETIEKEKAELIAIVTSRAQIKNAIQLNLNLQRDTIQRLSRITAEKESCDCRLKEADSTTQLLTTQIQDMTRSRQEKECAIEEHKRRVDELGASLATQDAALQELKDRAGMTRSRLISLQELQRNLEGFDEGVRTVMAGHDAGLAGGCGIIGLLADIIETEPVYETAVESFLGRRLQSVIVSSHQDCFSLIRDLKQHDSGRVSFVPKDLRAVAAADQGSTANSARLTALSNHIKTAAVFQPLVAVLFHNVFIVSDMEAAFSAWQQQTVPCTFVTPEGDILEPEGVLTAGSKNTATAGILQRNREIRQLEQEREKLDDELKARTNERERTAAELNMVMEILEQLKRTKHDLDLQLMQQETENRKLAEEARQCREKIELICAEQQEYESELLKHQQALKNLMVQEGSFKYNDDELQQALKNLQQNESSLQEEVKQAEALAVESRVKLEVVQQRHESAAAGLSAMVSSRSAAQARIDSLAAEITELNKRHEMLSAEIDRGQEYLAQLLLQHAAIDSEHAAEKEREQELEQDASAAEESLKKLSELKDAIEPRIHALDLDLREVSLRCEHLQDEMLEKYHCTLQELPPAPAAEDFIQEEQQEKLDKLKQRLENMGEVNLGAQAEYDEHKQRFDFLQAQEQDLSQSLDSLMKVIARINRITREKFQDAFNQVNAHFQEVFPLLFQGGKAYLFLTDETDLLETGIEIFAQPPGKKLQSLELLSGGERSLTVVALLFAIFLTKPSPFCLLDEIDAALDDNNIDRFNDHLQKMSAYSQFIMVTHSKQSMQAANTLYGITMQEQGVSKVVSVELH